MSWEFKGVGKSEQVAGILVSMAENMKEYTGQVGIDLKIEFGVDKEK